ncbi:hypothetical protein [Acidipropionibacterium timonense]|uniref:hypothetical protein n=1 Tax=Acidipropionibacterium timonense TaxID=2161818 RepID=UPI001032053A|nr:hypothetical protein [Acidipropionibacterium timonense]
MVLATVPTGMWVILAIGVGVLLVAALADRRSARPASGTVTLEPGTATDPRALPPMTQDLCDEVDELITQPGTVTVEAPLADPRCATHRAPDGRPTSVVRRPAVIVLVDPLEGARMAQAILRGAPRSRPLVVVAPRIDEFAAGVLVVNDVHGSLDITPLTADDDAHAAIRSCAGAQEVRGADLRRGWLPAPAWGQCALVLSDGISSTVVPVDDSPASAMTSPVDDPATGS